MTKDLGVSPATYVEGDELGFAARSLAAYYQPGVYTGAVWDRRADERRKGDAAYVIDAADLFLPTLLSAPVDRGAGAALLEPGRQSQITDLLRQIGPAVCLWDTTEGDRELEAAWKLYTLLQAAKWGDEESDSTEPSANNLGPTTASKLIAAKRPLLVPIWDSQLKKGLRPAPGRYWSGLASALDPDLQRKLENLATNTADAPDGLSPLRLLDVIVWMRVHGWNYAADDLTDFETHDGPWEFG